MATFDTTLITKQEGRSANLHYNPNMDVLVAPVRIARFEYTLAGTEASGDKIRLGYLGVNKAYVVPEQSSVVCPSGAGCAIVMTLKKVDTSATETALTAAATQVAANRVALARPATTPTVAAVNDTDYLELLLGTVTTATAGSVLLVEVAYYSEQAR